LTASEGFARLLPFMQWSNPEDVRAYVLSFGGWAPVIYLLVYSQPFVPLPILVMAMAAGLAFGALYGGSLALTAALIRACGQFFLARRLGRDACRRLLRGRAAALDTHMSQRGLSTVIWMRLIPNVPYDLQSLVLGCSPVTFSAFALGTFVGTVPWIVLSVIMGDALLHADVAWKAILIVIGLVGVWWLRRRASAQQP